MRTIIRSVLALGLVTIGYALGSSGFLTLAMVRAQEQGQGPTEETTDKIKAATAALDAAMTALQRENLYKPAFNGINAFAVTAGGLNAVEDLETGRGVDPETFAALYAGLATDEVAEELGRDDEGRMTYGENKKVIRMYPISRLKRMFAERAKLAGEEQ